MHRQTTTLARRFPGRAHALGRRLEQRGIAATYALHDRVLSNRAARRRQAAEPAPLDGLQRTLLEALDADGYAVVALEQLLGGAAAAAPVLEQGDAFVRATADALAAEHAGGGPELRRRAGKEFVIRANSFEGVSLDAGDAWFRACLSDRMLALANAYLRMWAKLSYVDLWYTVPQPPGSERAASQLWHLDFDDRHLLKAFLYLVDVDESGGPFEYVPGSQPGGRYDEVWRWSPARTGRVPDEEVRAHVPEGGVQTFTAPRGTVILCNTSGLHRGGFSTAAVRALATATYCSPASLRALSRRNYATRPELLQTLTPAARFAVS